LVADPEMEIPGQRFEFQQAPAAPESPAATPPEPGEQR
jgi:hypothetical protein